MLQFFRNFMKSKFGVVVTLAFLAVLAIAFASSDIMNNQTGTTAATGDRVAVVGKTPVLVSELSQAATNAFDTAREQNPTLTMAAFIGQGGLKSIYEQVLGRTVLAEFGRRNGLRAGKRLVDSELAQVPAFQGPDGKFNRQAFLGVLGQRQLTEANVRDDFATNLLTRQLITPVLLPPETPQTIAVRYASLLRERRSGAIGVLPSALFAPAGEPTDAQVNAFFQQARANFIRPERRIIRYYATFTDQALAALPAPTDAQIAARYQRDKVKYAASDKRTFTQLVLPTEAAANAVAAELKGGKSLAAAAQAKGLRAAKVGPIDKAAFVTASSASVADAGFNAAAGALTAPTRGGLGWYLLHVDAIQRTPARTLEQARGEIVTELARELRTAALADLTAKIEDQFDSGRGLVEVAQEYKLTVAQTAPVTADGKVYGQAGKTVTPELGRVLTTAFQMEEGKPQLAEVVPGQQFMIFDVPTITGSAVAPLAEVRPAVVALWRQSEGDKAARIAADAVLARVAKGDALASAMRAVKPNAPAARTVSLNREQLAQQGRVPPELALFFSMAKGTTKKLEAPNKAGWFVIRLDDVQAGVVPPTDPIIAATQRQLASVGSDEYLAQFVKAAEKKVGVSRNPAAVSALEAQLSGRAAAN